MNNPAASCGVLNAQTEKPFVASHGDLIEISSPDFPGARLVACRNPQLATRSKAALLKAARRTLDDGTPVNSFSNLTDHLLTIVRNTCRTANAGADAPTFEITTTPHPAQLRAMALIEAIRL